MPAAMAGERIPESDHIVCIMPLARGNCFSGTSMAYDVSKAAPWKVLGIAISTMISSNIQSCRLRVAMRLIRTRLSTPFGVSAVIMVRLRSWRSAQAPARARGTAWAGRTPG